ncbi:Rv3235 family protein [Jatrophihabitans sp.]|uniref:Rv3235 family protein n=1 Tax=Jatrophihabitans sp. TaxID=1932789 RepID=UPI002B9263C9|nr:Rv3235 family protein [Jatrophihabitans sp.]
MTMSAASAELAGARSGPAAGRRYLVKPAPRREPLFDDEVPERHLSLVGPLDQPLPLEGLDRDTAATQPDTSPDRPTGFYELPEPALIARRLVIGVVEIATGRRSASQLRDHTSPAVQAGLVRDAGRITRLGSAQRPATLHSLHVTEPADGVAEVAAVLRIENRFRALALRLEGLDGRWRCVRLQIG